MARYTGPVCRQCRRAGKKLFLKGERCYTDKCSFAVRSYAPGQHGQNQARKKLSEYGLQLREKQIARRYYGVSESQFAKYFEMADRKVGMTGENLLQICESRLDNVVYRSGFALSRKEARQLVLHRHFTVNGERVNIPSFLTKPGDVIEVREKSRTNEKIKGVIEANASKVTPSWIDCNAEQMNAKISKVPSREEIDFDVQEQLIVEYYSK